MQTPANGGYIAINPLEGVRYDNKYDLSLGMAYQHVKAGPNVLQGANLGGFDLSGSMLLHKRWRLESSVRGFYGTSGIGQINAVNQKGPFISEYFFTAGPEWRAVSNKHGAIFAHVLGGGAYGNFEDDLHGQTAQGANFYNNQVAPMAIVGGHIDLNRSPRWVFRITPDAVMTHYSINYPPNTAQFDVNFAISVGKEYKFLKKK